MESTSQLRIQVLFNTVCIDIYMYICIPVGGCLAVAETAGVIRNDHCSVIIMKCGWQHTRMML